MSLFEKSGPSRRTNAFSSAQKSKSERPFHARRRSRGGSWGDEGSGIPFELNIKDSALLSGKEDAEEKAEPEPQRDFTIGNLPDDMQRFLDGGSLDGAKGGANASASAANPFASATNPFASAASPFSSAANPFSSAANPFASAASPFSVTVSSADDAGKSAEASSPPKPDAAAATKTDASSPPSEPKDSSAK